MRLPVVSATLTYLSAEISLSAYIRASTTGQRKARSLNPRFGISKAQHPKRRPTVAPAVHEVSPIGRDCGVLKKKPGLLKVRDLLYGTTVVRHAVNVQVVW